jgi:hypothetical protein
VIIKLHEDFIKQAANLKPAQKKRLEKAMRLFQKEIFVCDHREKTYRGS